MSIAINGTAGQSTIRTWTLWIAVSAAIPVLGVAGSALVFRHFGFYFKAQYSLMFILFIALSLAPALMQWAVLGRLVPQKSLLLWLIASWVSAIFAYYILDGMRISGHYVERAFDAAASSRQSGASSSWRWLLLMFHVALISLSYNIAPLLTFGSMAQRPVRAFLLTTVVGACAAVLLFKLYSRFYLMDVRSFYPSVDMMQTSGSWRSLAQMATVAAVFGMVQGAISGYGLMRMFAPSTRPLAASSARVFGLVALMLVVAHVTSYAMSPLGYAAGFPDVRRTFSSAPATDRSGGAPILSFAHKITLPGPAWYAVPSVDGRTALAVMKDRSLLRIDLDRRVVIDAPLIAGEAARSVVFSPDGRYVAVSYLGERRGKGDFYFGRLRLFTTDGVAEIKDLFAAEQDCALSSTMTFSADSRLLWVGCERSQARPRDLLAIALQIPDLEVAERRHSPDALFGRGSMAFSDILATGNAAAVALYGGPNPSRQILILDVTQKEPKFRSRNTAELGGDGHGFAGLHLSSDAKLVTLAHGQLSDRLSKRDAYQSTGQFRTVDTETGTLVADFARQSGQGSVTQWSVAFDRDRGRFAGIGTTLASRQGTLVIWDQRTGQELQRITTAAYQSGRFSADGRWLALLARDENALYLYWASP